MILLLGDSFSEQIRIGSMQRGSAHGQRNCSWSIRQPTQKPHPHCSSPCKQLPEFPAKRTPKCIFLLLLGRSASWLAMVCHFHACPTFCPPCLNIFCMKVEFKCNPSGSPDPSGPGGGAAT